MEDLYSIILSNYLVLIPAFLVWLVGLIVAFIRWPRHPRVSLFSTLGLILFFIRALADPWIRFWIQHSGAPLTRIGVRFSIFNLANALVGALAWIFILIAVFGWRRESETLEEST